MFELYFYHGPAHSIFFSAWQCSKNCFFQKRYTRIPNTYQVCFISFSYWWNINIHAWNILFLHAKSIFFYDTYNLGLQVVFLLAKKSFGAPKWSRCRYSPKIYGDFLKMGGICLFSTCANQNCIISFLTILAIAKLFISCYRPSVVVWSSFYF